MQRRVLLHAVQGRLPQWAAVNPDGKVLLNRKYRRRARGQALAFVAQAICEINWADSGPGFSWPEAYHVVYVPGYERCVADLEGVGAGVAPDGRLRLAAPDGTVPLVAAGHVELAP